MRRRAVLGATAVLAAVVGCEAGVHEPTIGGKPNAAASKYIKEASDADFESIVAAHPDGLFAEFYAPWCGHCKQLAPVFEEVAEKLSKKKFADPPIPCVKVDATVNPVLAKKYEITGYPWLKLFVDGEVINYPDSMKRDTYHPLVNWAIQKTGRGIQNVDYTDALTGLREKFSLVVLGIFGKSDEGGRAAGRADFIQLARDDEVGIVFALHEPPAAEEGAAHESILVETLADELFADVPVMDRIMADDPADFAIRAPSIVIFRKTFGEGEKAVLTRISTADLYALSGTPAPGDAAQAAVKLAVRQQVDALYRVHNAKKISDLDNLFSKYRGKEVELLSAVRKKYDEPSSVGLRKMVAKASLPIPNVLTEWNKAQVFDHPAPYMATLFVGNDESHPEATTSFSAAAQAAAEELGADAAALQWLVVSGENWKGVLDNFGIEVSMLPAIRIIGNPGSSKTAKLPTYVFEGDPANIDDVKTFVSGFADGSLRPVFKGEDPPEADFVVPEGHLPVVVRGTFQQLVLDADHDVLVDVSLSNCGACKAFEPVLARFVKELRSGTGGLLSSPVELPVYKLTIDKNDIGDMADLLSQVDEYPALALYKVGAKEDPLLQEAAGMTVRQVGEWLAGRSSWQNWPEKWKHDTGMTSSSDRKAIAALATSLPEKSDVDFKTEAPPPEDQAGPVYKVVGSTFEKIVLDPQKDVLLEMYAPWCGHCKELAPIYDDVGRAFANADSVLVAKMDLTANEVDSSLLDRPRGFPTIRLWPKGIGSVPVEYEGQRESAASFVTFVAEHGKSSFSIVDGVAIEKDDL